MSASYKPTVTHQVHFESPLFHLQTHFELLWAKKRRLSSSLWNEINQLVSITCPLLSYSLSNSNNITYRDVFNEHRRNQRNCRWMRKQATFAGTAASATHRRDCSCNYSLLDLTDRPNTLGVLAHTHRCG